MLNYSKVILWNAACLFVIELWNDIDFRGSLYNCYNMAEEHQGHSLLTVELSMRQQEDIYGIYGRVGDLDLVE